MENQPSVLQRDSAGADTERAAAGADIATEVDEGNQLIGRGCTTPRLVDHSAGCRERRRGPGGGSKHQRHLVISRVLCDRAGHCGTAGGIAVAVGNLIGHIIALVVRVFVGRVAGRDQHQLERIRIEVDGTASCIVDAGVIDKGGHGADL